MTIPQQFPTQILMVYKVPRIHRISLLGAVTETTGTIPEARIMVKEHIILQATREGEVTIRKGTIMIGMIIQTLEVSRKFPSRDSTPEVIPVRPVDILGAIREEVAAPMVVVVVVLVLTGGAVVVLMVVVVVLMVVAVVVLTGEAAIRIVTELGDLVRKW